MPAADPAMGDHVSLSSTSRAPPTTRLSDIDRSSFNTDKCSVFLTSGSSSDSNRSSGGSYGSIGSIGHSSNSDSRLFESESEPNTADSLAARAMLLSRRSSSMSIPNSRGKAVNSSLPASRGPNRASRTSEGQAAGDGVTMTGAPTSATDPGTRMSSALSMRNSLPFSTSKKARSVLGVKLGGQGEDQQRQRQRQRQRRHTTFVDRRTSVPLHTPRKAQRILGLDGGQDREQRQPPPQMQSAPVRGEEHRRARSSSPRRWVDLKTGEGKRFISNSLSFARGRSSSCSRVGRGCGRSGGRNESDGRRADMADADSDVGGDGLGNGSTFTDLGPAIQAATAALAAASSAVSPMKHADLSDGRATGASARNPKGSSNRRRIRRQESSSSDGSYFEGERIRAAGSVFFGNQEEDSGTLSHSASNVLPSADTAQGIAPGAGPIGPEAVADSRKSFNLSASKRIEVPPRILPLPSRRASPRLCRNLFPNEESPAPASTSNKASNQSPTEVGSQSNEVSEGIDGHIIEDQVGPHGLAAAGTVAAMTGNHLRGGTQEPGQQEKAASFETSLDPCPASEPNLKALPPTKKTPTAAAAGQTSSGVEEARPSLTLGQSIFPDKAAKTPTAGSHSPLRKKDDRIMPTEERPLSPAPRLLRRMGRRSPVGVACPAGMRVEASTAMGATSCPKHVVDDASPATEPQAARDHPEQRRLPDQDRQHGITVLTGAPLETLGRGGGARETVDASLALRRAATERLARMMNDGEEVPSFCNLNLGEDVVSLDLTNAPSTRGRFGRSGSARSTGSTSSGGSTSSSSSASSGDSIRAQVSGAIGRRVSDGSKHYYDNRRRHSSDAISTGTMGRRRRLSASPMFASQVASPTGDIMGTPLFEDDGFERLSIAAAAALLQSSGSYRGSATSDTIAARVTAAAAAAVSAAAAARKEAAEAEAAALTAMMEAEAAAREAEEALAMLAKEEEQAALDAAVAASKLANTASESAAAKAAPEAPAVAEELRETGNTDLGTEADTTQVSGDRDDARNPTVPRSERCDCDRNVQPSSAAALRKSGRTLRDKALLAAPVFDWHPPTTCFNEGAASSKHDENVGRANKSGAVVESPVPARSPSHPPREGEVASQASEIGRSKQDTRERTAEMRNIRQGRARILSARSFRTSGSPSPSVQQDTDHGVNEGDTKNDFRSWDGADSGCADGNGISGRVTSAPYAGDVRPSDDAKPANRGSGANGRVADTERPKRDYLDETTSTAAELTPESGAPSDEALPPSAGYDVASEDDTIPFSFSSAANDGGLGDSGTSGVPELELFRGTMARPTSSTLATRHHRANSDPSPSKVVSGSLQANTCQKATEPTSVTTVPTTGSIATPASTATAQLPVYAAAAAAAFGALIFAFSSSLQPAGIPAGSSSANVAGAGSDAIASVVTSTAAAVVTVLKALVLCVAVGAMVWLGMSADLSSFTSETGHGLPTMTESSGAVSGADAATAAETVVMEEELQEEQDVRAESGEDCCGDGFKRSQSGGSRCSSERGYEEESADDRCEEKDNEVAEDHVEPCFDDQMYDTSSACSDQSSEGREDFEHRSDENADCTSDRLHEQNDQGAPSANFDDNSLKSSSRYDDASKDSCDRRSYAMSDEDFAGRPLSCRNKPSRPPSADAPSKEGGHDPLLDERSCSAEMTAYPDLDVLTPDSNGSGHSPFTYERAGARIQEGMISDGVDSDVHPGIIPEATGDAAGAEGALHATSATDEEASGATGQDPSTVFEGSDSAQDGAADAPAHGVHTPVSPGFELFRMAARTFGRPLPGDDAEGDRGDDDSDQDRRRVDRRRRLEDLGRRIGEWQSFEDETSGSDSESSATFSDADFRPNAGATVTGDSVDRGSSRGGSGNPARRVEGVQGISPGSISGEGWADAAAEAEAMAADAADSAVTAAMASAAAAVTAAGWAQEYRRTSDGRNANAGRTHAAELGSDDYRLEAHGGNSDGSGYGSGGGGSGRNNFGGGIEGSGDGGMSEQTAPSWAEGDVNDSFTLARNAAALAMFNSAPLASSSPRTSVWEWSSTDTERTGGSSHGSGASEGGHEDVVVLHDTFNESAVATTDAAGRRSGSIHGGYSEYDSGRRERTNGSEGMIGAESCEGCDAERISVIDNRHRSDFDWRVRLERTGACAAAIAPTAISYFEEEGKRTSGMRSPGVDEGRTVRDGDDGSVHSGCGRASQSVGSGSGSSDKAADAFDLDLNLDVTAMNTDASDDTVLSSPISTPSEKTLTGARFASDGEEDYSTNDDGDQSATVSSSDESCAGGTDGRDQDSKGDLAYDYYHDGSDETSNDEKPISTTGGCGSGNTANGGNGQPATNANGPPSESGSGSTPKSEIFEDVRSSGVDAAALDDPRPRLRSTLSSEHSSTSPDASNVGSPSVKRDSLDEIRTGDSGDLAVVDASDPGTTEGGPVDRLSSDSGSNIDAASQVHSASNERNSSASSLRNSEENVPKRKAETGVTSSTERPSLGHSARPGSTPPYEGHTAVGDTTEPPSQHDALDVDGDTIDGDVNDILETNDDATPTVVKNKQARKSVGHEYGRDFPAAASAMVGVISTATDSTVLGRTPLQLPLPPYLGLASRAMDSAMGGSGGGGRFTDGGHVPIYGLQADGNGLTDRLATPSGRGYAFSHGSLAQGVDNVNGNTTDEDDVGRPGETAAVTGGVEEEKSYTPVSAVPPVTSHLGAAATRSGTTAPVEGGPLGGMEHAAVGDVAALEDSSDDHDGAETGRRRRSRTCGSLDDYARGSRGGTGDSVGAGRNRSSAVGVPSLWRFHFEDGYSRRQPEGGSRSPRSAVSATRAPPSPSTRRQRYRKSASFTAGVGRARSYSPGGSSTESPGTYGASAKAEGIDDLYSIRSKNGLFYAGGRGF